MLNPCVHAFWFDCSLLFAYYIYNNSARVPSMSLAWEKTWGRESSHPKIDIYAKQFHRFLLVAYFLCPQIFIFVHLALIFVHK
jgi:hypothetical protein